VVEVLIVDDEATIREMLSVHFDLAKYTFREAGNGEEALERLDEHVSDVVVLDVMMPVMDGLETCRRIRENPRTALSYVIMLTAKDSVDDKVAGLDLGADAYLAKPFDPKELMALVRVGMRTFWDRQNTLMDPLTNLFNGRSFNAFLEMEISRASRYGHPLSLILLELGDFQNINERMGHATGDRILVQIAELLSASCRRGDLTSHWVGDRFAWLLPESNIEAVVQVRDRLLAAIDTFDFGIDQKVSFSTGIAELEERENPSSFIRRAETALVMDRNR
jgi:two-component system cell cycle response regulator